MKRQVYRSTAGVLVATMLLAACSDGRRGDGEPSVGADAAPISSASAEGLSDELSVSSDGWSTDFTRHEVPLDEFLSGGPGKGGIPAIDKPEFAEIASIDWLDDQEPVIMLGIDDEWRAYPIQILIWHEIVNDTIAGMPVTVTFCPLCHTAVVFDRSVDGQVLDFGVSGNLRHSDLVMYDRQTESWWQQATGRGIVGEFSGTALELLASQLVSWAQFKELHPDGLVLTRNTGHSRDYGANPYAGYDRADSDPFLLEDRTLIDGRLNPKVRIVGIVVDGEEVAYPLPDLAEATVVNDDVGDEPIGLFWSPGTASGLGDATVAGGELVGSAVVYSRTAPDGTTLQFEQAGEGRMTDTQTGSTWDVGGTAVDGPLSGTRLESVPNDQPFWFAWAIFRPDTVIWQP
ncbi:MAG: DUF3179 domain-containing protein [Chloroflexota bacterium]|nr:DUF3179 domain-containing protein [Chloroflexota bacterium]